MHSNPRELFCKEILATKGGVTSITNITGNLQFADILKTANIQRCCFSKKLVVIERTKIMEIENCERNMDPETGTLPVKIATTYTVF